MSHPRAGSHSACFAFQCPASRRDKIRALIVLILLVAQIAPAFARARWSQSEANGWYSKQPWYVGVNFIPSSAVNQLEMFQAETFDAPRIGRELALAQSLGMNAIRVFLHDQL